MQPTHYVGIGASAGGLEAIESFFKHMPADNGLAFIVVQHLSPDYKSLMKELLSKHTDMPVVRIEEGMLIEANTVYLIPPKRNLTIFHGKLLLHEQDYSRGINLPIDIFLRSLAEDQGEKAIGVILSGTGSDGTRGIRAIKEMGGMVMVQDEDSAKFDGMPKSALATGLTDFVQAPETMPQQLLSFVKHPYASKSDSTTSGLISSEDGLTRIYSLLRENNKVDFTYYKPATVLRRIERRMSVNQIHELRDYVRYMESYPREVSLLYRELLIGVTNFFRDPKAFEALQSNWLPPLLEHSNKREIRFWVAGCSTGEEAYSLAIACRECMVNLGHDYNVKIFATDVDRNAIIHAGTGTYPESIVADLPPTILNKYFQRHEGNFQITRSIREMVVFAQHNLLKDPPFTNIDLVSCRNLLIYLQPVLQKKVFELFSFSLNANALLFLGSSESVGDMTDNFELLNNKWRIYRAKGKRSATTRLELDSAPSLNSNFGPLLRQRISLPRQPFSHEEERVLVRLLDFIAANFIPFMVVVNENLEPVHVLGDASGYFTLAPGKSVHDVTKMAVKNLAIPLATGLQKVFKTQEELRYNNIRLNRGGNDNHLVYMHLKPVPGKKGQEPLVAVCLEEAAPMPNETDNQQGAVAYDLGLESQQRITDLEQELLFTRENLQATIEELETSNEELQATNEELVASNEELQSTNEELQSVNEELHTVNAEHQRKIIELTEMTNDLDNLLRGTQIGTIFLDEALMIRRYTPSVTQLFNLLDADIGRPIAHITHHLRNINLLGMLEETLRSHKSQRHEIQSTEGHTYLLHVLPYRISPTEYAGLVLNFIDIQDTKTMQLELARSQERYTLAQKAAKIGSWEWNIQTGELLWSDVIESMFGLAPGTFAGTYEAFIAYVHPEDRDYVEQHVNTAIKKDVSYNLEHRIVTPNGEIRWLAEIGEIYRDIQGKATRMVGMVRDITQRKNNETAIQQKNARLDSVLRASPLGAGIVKNRVFEWVNDKFCAMVGYNEAELLGQSSRMVYPSDEEYQHVGDEKYRQLQQTGVGRVKTQFRHKNGQVFNVFLSSAPLNPDDLTGGMTFTVLNLDDCGFCGR